MPYWQAAKVTALCFFSALPLQAADITIAALGDSLTQGYGLPAEQGFVPQLEDWLRAEYPNVRVLNAGVSGDTTAGGLARIDWTLTPDVDALIVALGGNDILRGIAPEVSRANLSGIMDVAQGQNLPVLLIGISAPGNYGPDYKQDFDAIYPDLARDYDTLLIENFFAALGEDPTEFRALMQADGIHPNALGVRRMVESIGPTVLELIDKTQSITESGQ